MIDSETTCINVKTPTGLYPILIGAGVSRTLGQLLADGGYSATCAVISNQTVAPLHAEPVLDSLRDAGFLPILVELPDGEVYKTLAGVADIYNDLLAAGLERKSVVIALGGGVVGDMAGFAAATYLRGVPFVQIPTSLLAMVDASVGGKTGVDLPQGKNLVGAFKQPEMVLIDPDLLSTLPAAEFRAGLAEVVKHGILAGDPLFTALNDGKFTLDWLLYHAIQVKVDVVTEDPFEQGRRATLNLGHTFGHAFEKLSNFEIRHGDGVAMGMRCAIDLGRELGYCPTTEAERMLDLLHHLDLPTEIPDFDPEAVWQVMHTDKKKAGGSPRFVLPRAVGDVDLFSGIPPAIVKQILQG